MRWESLIDVFYVTKGTFIAGCGNLEKYLT
jgi:hypothetical protein